MVETPRSFVVAEERRKATFDSGFRKRLGEVGGWACFGSTTAKGTLAFAAAGSKGPWFLAIDHPGVVAELVHPKIEMPGPGMARYAFAPTFQLVGRSTFGLHDGRAIKGLTDKHRPKLSWYRRNFGFQGACQA